MNSHASTLLKTADPTALQDAYAAFIRSVLESPLWSAGQPDGIRVPWRSAREASKSPEWRGVFLTIGLYIFGSEAGVPLYLGKTGMPFRKRMNRYVFGSRCQCQLAADYGLRLTEHGINGFPDEVRAWYDREYKGTARLEGAVTFARHGIEGIWFTLLPISGPDTVRPLEKRLIPVANAWNRRHGLPSLLNVLDI